jgi:hypothetical protein
MAKSAEGTAQRRKLLAEIERLAEIAVCGTLSEPQRNTLSLAVRLRKRHRHIEPPFSPIVVNNSPGGPCGDLLSRVSGRMRCGRTINHIPTRSAIQEGNHGCKRRQDSRN